jgi:hypothetical protein
MNFHLCGKKSSAQKQNITLPRIHFDTDQAAGLHRFGWRLRIRNEQCRTNPAFKKVLNKADSSLKCNFD